jgi:hypothetical protein
MQTKTSITHPVSSLSVRLWSEAAVLGMIAMELTWITAWYILTTQPQSSLGTTILILGLVLTGSYGLGRAVSALHWRLAIRRLVFLFWLAFCVFFSLKVLLLPQIGLAFSALFTHPLSAIFANPWGGRQFWHVLVICLLGLRGASLSTTVVEQHRVLASLQLGMLMFLLYGLGKSITDPIGTALVFFIFLSFGMISLSAASIAGISDLRGGRLPRLSWTWTAGILFSSLLVAGIAVLSGWLFSIKMVSAFLGQIVLGIITVLFTLIALVLFPVLFLLYGIITYLAQIMSWIIDRKVLDAFAQSLSTLNHMGQGQVERLTNTNDLRNIILGIVIAAVILITLVILRRQPRKRRLVAEENNLRSITKRDDYNLGKTGDDWPGWFHPRRLLAAANVRRIYAQLMDLCEKLGHPRPAALTPLEFLPTLKQIFPEGEVQVSLITNAYLKVRYGELPETTAEVEDIRRAWNWLAKQRTRFRKLSLENKSGRKKP